MGARIPLTPAPEKAKWGEPCNGCGHCCASEVCKVGLMAYGPDTPAPCPGMRFADGRFLCGAVLIADELGPEYGASIRLILGVGMGCDSDD